MNEPLRVDVYEAREKVARGDALLVCAYEDRRRFRSVRLEGAIPVAELEGRRSSVGRDSEIIVYCACPRDTSAVNRAAELSSRGFLQAKVLLGGFDAWKRAGFPVVADRSLLARARTLFSRVRRRGAVDA